MKLTTLSIVIICLLFASCRVTEQNIAGTYFPQKGRPTRLILNADKTFDLALLNPGTDTLIFPSHTHTSFFTTGRWSYEKNRLTISSIPAGKNTNGSVEDSISRFTTISSFNFWNRFGDPVSIRYIILPSSKTKPHYGNSLYFFSQDFKPTDTVRFFFDGYPPFDFPGSVPATIGNNMHKIVLIESYRAAAFTSLRFIVRKNKLLTVTGKKRFTKKK